MDREQKSAVVDRIAADLRGSEAIFAVDYRGISVPQAAELRGRLAEADAAFKVVKNRLAKLAVDKVGTEGLDGLLEGPTALTLVKGDPVIAAKAISTFSREHDVLAYKGGIMDGAPLDPEKFNAIARLPALEVLHGQLVGVAASPLTGLARGLGSLVGGLAVALGQIQEQGLVGDGQAEDEAAEPESAPSSDEVGADAEVPAVAPEPEPDQGAEAEDAGAELETETETDQE